jgi:glutamine synthetase
MAAMLGAMLQGIEEGVMPPPRKTRCSRAPGLRCRSNGARRWLPLPPRSARRRMFGARFCAIYLACKQQDRAMFLRQIDRFEYDTYLGLL